MICMQLSWWNVLMSMSPISQTLFAKKTQFCYQFSKNAQNGSFGTFFVKSSKVFIKFVKPTMGSN